MKTLKIAATIIASAFTFTSAFAQGGADCMGHYEWRSAPQYGPRAPMQAPKRVWVQDHAQMAKRICDMMKMSPADCMKNMHGMMSPSDASAS